MNAPVERPTMLPPALDEVRPPVLLNPSRFADLLRCPLSVVHGLPEEELLPPRPLALLGEVIHDVMSAARDAESGSESGREVAFARLFAERVEAMEARLSEDPLSRRLVPLRRAVGRTEWRRREARLRAWMAAVSVLPERRPGREDSGTLRNDRNRTGEARPTTRVSTGRERTLRVPRLRLSGRADLVEQGSDGVFHVTDLKTGTVLDVDGRALEGHALQLRLYALMIENVDPRAKVRLWVEGLERVEIGWDDDARAETAQTLGTVAAELPSDRTVAAESIAREGPHCGRCRIRHRCPRYLRAAPAWWAETSTLARVAPFDAWGTVLAAGSDDGETIDLVIRDAAGRKVRVRGLDVGSGAEGLRCNDHVWLFDLQPTEDLPRHGAYFHPRNFHGKRPSKAWTDAQRLRIFWQAARATDDGSRQGSDSNVT